MFSWCDDLDILLFYLLKLHYISEQHILIHTFYILFEIFCWFSESIFINLNYFYKNLENGERNDNLKRLISRHNRSKFLGISCNFIRIRELFTVILFKLYGCIALFLDIYYTNIKYRRMRNEMITWIILSA